MIFIQKKSPALIAIALILLSVSNGCKAGGQENLGPKEFKDVLSQPGIQVVDIRTPLEFSTGYIVGAENIDFYQSDFSVFISALNKSKPLAIYCKSGGRTKDALKMFSNAGFIHIYTLGGGLMAWEKAGYKLVIPKPVKPVMTSVSKQEFDILIHSDSIVIVEFGATWCGPCKMLKPVLDKLSVDFAGKGVKIVTIDVDASKDLSNELLVNEIPLLLFYKRGILMEQMIGFNPEPIIRESIEKYL